MLLKVNLLELGTDNQMKLHVDPLVLTQVHLSLGPLLLVIKPVELTLPNGIFSQTLLLALLVTTKL